MFTGEPQMVPTGHLNVVKCPTLASVGWGVVATPHKFFSEMAAEPLGGSG